MQEIQDIVSKLRRAWRRARARLGADAPAQLASLGKVARAAARRVNENSVLARWILAGPMTVLVSVAVIAAMPLWIPAADYGTDRIAFPVILMPLVWLAAFFYALLDPRPARAAAVFAGGLAVNLLSIAAAFAAAEAT